MIYLFFIISFSASIIGSICGIGGGVIIKPLLDTTGLMTVTQISYLSGCTVLSMAVVNVFKAVTQKNNDLNLKIATPLAIGAAIGGILGKSLFQFVKEYFQSETRLGTIQSVVLLLITAGTLIYTLKQSQIKTLHFKNSASCVLMGLLLGILSVFLGIGGGPINLAVLSYFFSMKTKEAATNSIYIILISQITSLLQMIVNRTIPSVGTAYLLCMIFAGVFGAIIGSRVNKKISGEIVQKLFILLMCVILGICGYNIYQFSAA